MATNLHLVVPEEEQSVAVIHDYFDFLKEKFDRDEHGSEDHRSLLDARRESAVTRYEEDGRFAVFERFHPDAPTVDEYRELWDLLDEYEQGLFEQAKIERALELLHTIERELADRAPITRDGSDRVVTETAIKRQFEIGPIAVCEFALEHGYGIFYDY